MSAWEEKFNTIDHPFAAPCKDCANRRIGCHSDCAEYKHYREKVERYRYDTIRKKEIDYGICSIVFQPRVLKRAKEKFKNA